MLTAAEKYALASRCAFVAGAAAVLFFTLLMVDFTARVIEDPLNTPEFVAAKARIKADPRDEAAKADLRELDLKLRDAYFQRRRFTVWGTWLLLFSTALAVGCGKWAAVLHRRLPRPVARDPSLDPEEQLFAISRWAVASVGGLIVLGVLVTWAGTRSPVATQGVRLADASDDASPPAATTSAAQPAAPTPAPSAPLDRPPPTESPFESTAPQSQPSASPREPSPSPFEESTSPSEPAPSPFEPASPPTEPAPPPTQPSASPVEAPPSAAPDMTASDESPAPIEQPAPAEPQAAAGSPGAPAAKSAAPSDLESATQDKPAVEAPSDAPMPPEPPATAADEAARRNWPRFRGWQGTGVSEFARAPTVWDATSGEGILWKTPLPLAGNNSPIVWDKRVFVTAADETRRLVICCNADTGAILWTTEATGTPASTATPPKVAEATGYAASTAAADGRRVYAIFANGDLVAVDFAGQVSWSRSLGLPKNVYGHAASLTLAHDLLIVQFDQGARQDKISRLMALKVDTGETAWETPREVPNSWTTPIVIEHEGREQIITAADPWVIAYAPADGRELWRAKCLQADVGPSPTFANGTVFVANEFPGMTAIRADGTGDVTDSHVMWEADVGAPDCCSPLATDRFLLVLASYGTLACYDARKGGDPLWEHDFDDTKFTSSPSLAGKLVYLFDESGKVFIVEPTEQECRTVGEATLGEPCVTSPAFQDGRMYVRGKQHLFCIGAPGP